MQISALDVIKQLFYSLKRFCQLINNYQDDGFFK
jgi:hypothetical protein